MTLPIVWITGQPGSGKTTLAQALLSAQAVTHVVDGEDLRACGLPVDYSREGRMKNVDRAMAIAMYLACLGHGVAVSLVSPYAEMREELKRQCTVVEVYLTCSEIRGRESYFVEDYEPPVNPTLEFDTAKVGLDEEVRAVLGEMATAALGS